MLRRLAAPLAALALLLCAPAAALADDAGPVAINGPDVQAAVKVAQQHWGAVPCSGQVQLDWVASPDTLLNALSTWLNPLTAWLNPDKNTGCKIQMNPNAQWDWPKLCTVMTHEVGHLLGHPHVTDPNDLMAPIYKDPLPECLNTPEPEGKLGAAMPVAPADPAQAAAAAPSASASPAVPVPAPVAVAPVAALPAAPLAADAHDHDVSIQVETAAPAKTTKAARAAALRTCLRGAARRKAGKRASARAACLRRATTASVRAAIR